MKLLSTWTLIALLGGYAGIARGELQMIPSGEAAYVFAGTGRTVTVLCRNATNTITTADVRIRLLQTSSATATTIGEWPWKRLQVVPGQTISENASLDFPAVKGETRFLVQWLENTNRVLGMTEIIVCPTNLLAELIAIAGDEDGLGIFDPANQLKPLLKNLKVDFADLEEVGFDHFHGKLAIAGPFTNRPQMGENLRARIEAAASQGAAVVWIQPPPKPRAKLQPSFYPVSVGTNTVIVVQSSLVDELVNNPQSQLNLLRLCRLALNPEPVHLPGTTNQP